MPPTPLTAIAQTPRKELESKFTFNPVLAKVRILDCLFVRDTRGTRAAHAFVCRLSSREIQPPRFRR